MPTAAANRVPRQRSSVPRPRARCASVDPCFFERFDVLIQQRSRPHIGQLVIFEVTSCLSLLYTVIRGPSSALQVRQALELMSPANKNRTPRKSISRRASKSGTATPAGDAENADSGSLKSAAQELISKSAAARAKKGKVGAASGAFCMHEPGDAVGHSLADPL